eukprot:6190808-Pleurochrysis_carterae.AAC.4
MQATRRRQRQGRGWRRGGREKRRRRPLLRWWHLLRSLWTMLWAAACAAVLPASSLAWGAAGPAPAFAVFAAPAALAPAATRERARRCLLYTSPSPRDGLLS